MKNVDRTIISQYSSSSTINSLLHNINNIVDPAADIDNFYNLVWNVDTARGWGLDVWGRIVGVVRVLNVASGKYFGFIEATNVSADMFGPGGRSPFYSGAALTSNFSLSDSAFRTLIYAKALANICDGSVKAINQVMKLLFPGRGNCYVTDPGNMAFEYIFRFQLTDVEAAIVSQSGILPKPVGVRSTVTQIY